MMMLAPEVDKDSMKEGESKKAINKDPVVYFYEFIDKMNLWKKAFKNQIGTVGVVHTSLLGVKSYD